MIKLYVNKDSDISEDCLFADETKLVSYFEESECELENEDCKLFLLEDYVKDKYQQVRADERKKVCEQIYKLFTNEIMWKEIKKWWLHNGECKELKNILNQVEKGEK